MTVPIRMGPPEQFHATLDVPQAHRLIVGPAGEKAAVGGKRHAIRVVLISTLVS